MFNQVLRNLKQALYVIFIVKFMYVKFAVETLTMDYVN